MRGLVLEGGGALGAYHIGAYKALDELGIDIDGVTGTSIGALNGAMIIQGDYEIALDLWNNISYDMVVDIGKEDKKLLESLDFQAENIKSLGISIRNIVKNRGLDITPLKKLIGKYIDEEKIRRSKKDFGLVTVNLSDMEALELFKEDIPNGELPKYILASAYLPGFKFEKLGGKYYLDGAFYDNLPFSMLRNKGYDEFIYIRTHATGLTKSYSTDNNNIEIKPSQDLGKSYNYEKEQAQKNIKLGYYDTLKKFKKLRGKVYTIRNNISEDEYFNMILSLDYEKTELIKKVFKLEEIPTRRAIFEIIIPKLADILKLDKGYTYSDFILALLEYKASILSINEFEIYDFNELVNKVIYKNNFNKNQESTDKDYFIDITDIQSVFNKEKIISKITDIIFI